MKTSGVASFGALAAGTLAQANIGGFEPADFNITKVLTFQPSLSFLGSSSARWT
jgi:hypothetical protein